MNLTPFWSPARWSLPFGVWGRLYSIAVAPGGGGYHIGLDVASTGDIPALASGRVVRVVHTTTMAWCVVVEFGDGLWVAYCHLADDRLPTVGRVLARGDRVGRPALGARSSSSPDWGGTAWLGAHVHTVFSTHPDSAYSYIPGHRTLAAFRDPDPIIRNILEEDDMFTDNDRAVLGKLYDLLTPGVQGVKFDGDVITRLKSIDDKAALSAERAAWGDIRNQSTVFVRDEPGFGKEWARVDAALPPLETNAAVDGFRVTTDEATARLWALAGATQQFARSSFRPISVTRAEYIALQSQWRQNARDWREAVALAVKGN